MCQSIQIFKRDKLKELNIPTTHSKTSEKLKAEGNTHKLGFIFKEVTVRLTDDFKIKAKQQ